jgi:hypothetical protein
MLVSHSTQDGDIITHTDLDGTISTDELGPVRSMDYPLICANLRVELDTQPVPPKGGEAIC